MKKLIFILVLMVSVGSIFAQSDAKKPKTDAAKGKKGDPGKVPSPEERAEKITNRLKTDLTLTDEQAAKVKQISLTRATSMKAAREKNKDNKQAFGQERKTIMQAWDKELKTILTPEQSTKFEAKKEENRKKMKEAKAAKKPVEEDETKEDE